MNAKHFDVLRGSVSVIGFEHRNGRRSAPSALGPTLGPRVFWGGGGGWAVVARAKAVGVGCPIHWRLSESGATGGGGPYDELYGVCVVIGGYMY